MTLRPISDLPTHLVGMPPALTHRRSRSIAASSAQRALGSLTCGRRADLFRANLGLMNDADRVSARAEQGKRDAIDEVDEVRRSEEASRRAELLSEINRLVQPALDAQKAAEYPDLETVEVVGAGESASAAAFGWPSSG